MGHQKKYRIGVVAMEKMQAYSIFLKRGMEAVIETYPEYQGFVSENSGKTWSEVMEIIRDWAQKAH